MIKIYLYPGVNLSDKYVDSQVVVSDIKEADAVIVRSTKIKSEDIPDNVRIVVRAGAGYNNIDCEGLKIRGIKVCNTPGMNSSSVVELALCMMIMGLRNVPQSQYLVGSSGNNGVEPDNQGELDKYIESNKKHYVGRELSRCKVGIIGLGHIGLELKTKLMNLRVSVEGYDPVWDTEDQLDKVLTESDILSFHIPCNESTKGLINKELISKMKKGVILLNLSRREIVNEDDLIVALENNQVGYYMTDFASVKMMNQLSNLKYFMTPHIGASTTDAESKCVELSQSIINNYLIKGDLRYCVNKD